MGESTVGEPKDLRRTVPNMVGYVGRRVSEDGWHCQSSYLWQIQIRECEVGNGRCTYGGGAPRKYGKGWPVSS